MQDALANLVFMHVDVSEESGQKLRERFGVRFTPQYLITSAGAEPIGLILGYSTPEAWLNALAGIMAEPITMAEREQRFGRYRGWLGRVHKVFHRFWTRSTRLDRTYLDRNCLFEPVQHQDPQSTTREAIATTEASWKRGEPVVMEAHRINFAHLDSTVHALGRQEFDHLLGALDAGAPLYLSDGELAGLTRRGTSWAVRGDQIVVRNLSRTRRLVVVPEDAMAVLARRTGRAMRSPGSQAIALGPGETQVLGFADFIAPQFPSIDP